MTYLSCPDAPAAKEYATVYVAWELSKADWKLGMLLPGAQQLSRFTVKGGDLAAAGARLAAARAKAAKSGLPVRILSCYESGLRRALAAPLARGPGGAKTRQRASLALARAFDV